MFDYSYQILQQLQTLNNYISSLSETVKILFYFVGACMIFEFFILFKKG